jgi:hypothetical protein
LIRIKSRLSLPIRADAAPVGAGAAAAGSMLTHRAAQGLEAYLLKRTPRPAADRPSLALDHA